MPTRDFHIIIVWRRFPSPWPPSRLELVLRQPRDGGAVEVWAHTDGHVEMVVSPSGAADSARIHFQRLQPPARPTAAVVELTNAGCALGMAVNETSLKSLSDAGEIPYVLPFWEPPPPERSIEHADARAACAEWISARQRRFSERKPYRPKGDRERVKKTIAQQVDELRQSVLALRDDIEQVSNGAKHRVPGIAAALRSLVYWPNLKPTWNPLLLRLANVRQLALPVFGFLESAEGPPTKGLVLHIKNIAPSITREFKDQRLMDLEAYLGLRLLKAIRDDGQISTLSVGETLGGIASSQGTSHYDETIDLDIDRLNRIVTVRTTLSESVLLRVGGAIAELADHVVKKLES